MMGFKNMWHNILANFILVMATCLLYVILDKEKLTLTLGVAIVLSVTGIVISWLNKEKEAVKKSIDEKVPRVEYEIRISGIKQEIYDHKKADSEKYELIHQTTSETNTMVRQILAEMLKSKSKTK